MITNSSFGAVGDLGWWEEGLCAMFFFSCIVFLDGFLGSF